MALRSTLLAAGRVMVPACAVVPLVGLLPDQPLVGPLAMFAYWISESGSARGLPVVAGVMVGLMMSSGDAPASRRAKRAAAIVVVLIIGLGGVSYLNEYVVKPKFGQPRPYVMDLADRGVLGMSADTFYALPTKATRSEYLREVLHVEQFKDIEMDPLIREHWVDHAGFSFPSGHSVAAMFCAGFFLPLGLEIHRGRMQGTLYLLIQWAVLVCWSRAILRVHSVMDVTTGAIFGAILGLLFFVAVRPMLAERDSPPQASFSKATQ